MTRAAYIEVIEQAFAEGWKKGRTEVPFTKEDLERIVSSMDLTIRNIPDVIYTFRYRDPLPTSITDLAPEGTQWVIMPTGRATYKFALASDSNILPNPNLEAVKVPDSTPEAIRLYSQTDEQATLARVRYNRLIDLFLGVNAFSLQNHLRTTVADIGQIEIDELYVGVGTHGTHFVIPVQAKGGSDRIGVVQTYQDLAFCAERFPNLVPRAIAVFRISDEVVALLDLVVTGGGTDLFNVKIRDERHYRLVAGSELSEDDLLHYRTGLG